MTVGRGSAIQCEYSLRHDHAQQHEGREDQDLRM